MTDALSAVDIAAFGLLDAGIVGATVHQHTPADQVPPVVIIGDLDEVYSLGGKAASRNRAGTLSIVVVTEGEERAPCSALLDQVEQLLDRKTVTAAGFNVSFEFRRSSSVLAEDGLGYIGLAELKIYSIAA